MDLREVSGTERHPWEVARARFFLAELARSGAVAPGAEVLDAGSGDAWFAGCLAERFGAQVCCWDEGYASSTPASGGRPLRFVAARPAQAFDLATLLDVAEHVEDDRAFVAAIVAENLKPAAQLLFSVPAWPALFTAHDEFLRHHRRYTPAQARRLLTGAGLTIVRSGGLFHSLVAPRAVARVAELVRGRRQVSETAIGWRSGAVVTGALTAVLRADNAVSAGAAALGLALPGLSFWALCRKEG